MRIFLASPLGFLIGVSLGAVGGGGSILAVPALVYAAGLTPKEATTASLILVGGIAVAGLPSQLRARRVRVSAGVVFAITGVAGSVAGTSINHSINPDALLMGFAALMLVAATAMVVRSQRASRTLELLGDKVPATAPVKARVHIDAATAVKFVVAGTVVGFLTGLFGVGGGFVIVPALVLALGFGMPEAAATSLLVIALNSGIALAQRYHGQHMPWNAIIAFSITAVPGVFVGTRLSRTMEPKLLANWFAAILVGVALYTAARSGIALATT